MNEVVSHAGDITPEWLTGVLANTGNLKSKVTDVSCEQIGAGVGLMAELSRLTVQYDSPEPNLPGTIIAKCAARNDNRAVAQLLDFYNRETNFYNKVAPTCPFRVPHSYYGAVNNETYDFVLLMEDLGDVSPVDQLVGSTEAEAFDKIEKIAKLHAFWWGKCDQPENSWMYDFMSPAEMQKLRDFVYMPSLEPAIENFSSFFGNGGADLCRKVGEQYAEIVDKITPAYTFLHGDYRQDNFIIRAGSDEPVIMDWQISGAGIAIFDVTYFICQSLQTDLRQKIQKPLIERYVACLAENGVKDYAFEQAWNDYRGLTLFCLIYPITVCGSLDLGNDRGRALAECMLERNLSAVEDLDSGEFLS